MTSLFVIEGEAVVSLSELLCHKTKEGERDEPEALLKGTEYYQARISNCVF